MKRIKVVDPVVKPRGVSVTKIRHAVIAARAAQEVKNKVRDILSPAPRMEGRGAWRGMVTRDAYYNLLGVLEDLRMGEMVDRACISTIEEVLEQISTVMKIVGKRRCAEAASTGKKKKATKPKASSSRRARSVRRSG